LCADIRGTWLTKETADSISWCCAGGKVTGQPYTIMPTRTAWWKSSRGNCARYRNYG